MAQFPHCNQDTIHAPGTCQYCDMHPGLQAVKFVLDGEFSPSEGNGWVGNVAKVYVAPVDTDAAGFKSGESWVNFGTAAGPTIFYDADSDLKDSVDFFKSLLFGDIESMVEKTDLP